MENLGIKELKDVLRIAEIASGTPDRDLLGREVLDAVAGALGVEKCMFILQEEGTPSPEFFCRGLERADIDRYILYFHSQDPLCLLAKESDHLVVPHAVHPHATVSLRETVAYDDFITTEYYKEFYRPQGIFHEIATHLESSTRVRGVIDLLRSERDPAFSAREIQVMDCLAPHLSRALDGIEMRREIQTKNCALAHYENQLTESILLCDERSRVVYASEKAREALEGMTGSPGLSPLPIFLRDDLEACRELAKTLPEGVVPAPWRREIRLATGRYQLTYDVSHRLDGPEKRRLSSISIRRGGANTICRKDILGERFGLTNREAEIIDQIFDGRTNAEIGEELFISEFTVKKHLQNICEKLNVKSRTAILSSVLRALDGRAPGRFSPSHPSTRLA